MDNDILYRLVVESNEVAQNTLFDTIVARIRYSCDGLKRSIETLSTDALGDLNESRVSMDYLTVLWKYAYLVAAMRVLIAWLERIYPNKDQDDNAAAVDITMVLNAFDFWKDEGDDDV